jgi:quercetin dioxygenase-like cupin family protein
MHECPITTKRVAAMTALVAIAIPLAGAMAQALAPTSVFEGNATTPAKDGAAQAVHVSVQSWGIAGQEHEIPLRGFYVAHLLSGQISTTIDGQTTDHLPGDYWTVKSGAAMRVKVVGDVAVLETTTVAKE